MGFHKNFWGVIAAGRFVASNAVAGTELTVYTAVEAEGTLEPYAPTVSATVSRRRQAWLRRCTPRVTKPWRMRTPAEV